MKRQTIRRMPAKADEKKPAKKARKKKLPVLESRNAYTAGCARISVLEKRCPLRWRNGSLIPRSAEDCGICAKDCPAEAIEMKEED